MSDKVDHPIFARLYHRMSAKAEDAGEDGHRRELLACLQGRVLELGAGNGLNFEHYPATVDEVVAVELEADGCLTRHRVGARNVYELHADRPLRHPMEGDLEVGDLLRLLGTREQHARERVAQGA